MPHHSNQGLGDVAEHGDVGMSWGLEGDQHGFYRLCCSWCGHRLLHSSLRRSLFRATVQPNLLHAIGAVLDLMPGTSGRARAGAELINMAWSASSATASGFAARAGCHDHSLAPVAVWKLLYRHGDAALAAGVSSSGLSRCTGFVRPNLDLSPTVPEP
jgi:hypothetical protein